MGSLVPPVPHLSTNAAVEKAQPLLPAVQPTAAPKIQRLYFTTENDQPEMSKGRLRRRGRCRTESEVL